MAAGIGIDIERSVTRAEEAGGSRVSRRDWQPHVWGDAWLTRALEGAHDAAEVREKLLIGDSWQHAAHHMLGRVAVSTTHAFP